MYVETGRGKLPLHFGMNALAKFADLTNRSMDDVLEALSNMMKMKPSEILIFVYTGFAEGARKEGQECLVKSAEDVGDMIDDDKELLGKVMDAYAQTVPQGEESKDKKK